MSSLSAFFADRVSKRVLFGAVAAAAMHHRESVVVVAFLILVLEPMVDRVLVKGTRNVAGWCRRWFYLNKLNRAPGFNWLVGHTLPLSKAVGAYPCTWDLFAFWSVPKAPKPVRVQIFTRHCVVIADPEPIRRVFNSNIKNYGKDTEFAYNPFSVSYTHLTLPTILRV